MSHDARAPETLHHGTAPHAVATPHAPVEGEGLQRTLRARHMNMIAIGGAIGTGLFLASGASIQQAGPGGALVAYAAIGVMVFFLMQSLGEMATYMPVSGSFQTYSTRFVSPSFGFAMGWNYWYNWAITVAIEMVAAGVVMKYWLPDSPGWLWSALALVILFGLNAMSARAYGEGEFWFASIKVVAIIVFLLTGLLMIAGILGGKAPGFENWVLDGGEAGKAPFPTGFAGILSVFMVAGFSFQGTELVGIAAGESEDPEHNIPKAIRSVFFRIVLFYLGAIAIIGFLLPFTDPNLINADQDVAVSPFTLVFQRAGIAAAASLMNAVILTSILSAGNSGLYASTRMLWSLAKEGKAPKTLTRVTGHGVPLLALIVTAAVGLVGFVLSLISEQGAYLWLVNASGMAGFVAWAGIAWSHFNFRRAFLRQGHSLSELRFKALFFPLGPLMALVMCLLVIAGQNYAAFSDGFSSESLGSFLATYIGLFLFLAVWGIHKAVTKLPAADLATADLSRGDLDTPVEPVETVH